VLALARTLDELDPVDVIDTPWRVGEVVADQYVIRKQIGLGGMSTVWEAHDRVMRRTTALKTALTRESASSLLVREARALAAVNHPGLPVPYTVGTYRGWTFLAFERLFGASLEHRIHDERPSTRQAFSIADALHVLVGLADALAAVHGAGIVHHDVKPANVMLCAGGRVVLLDFGIMIPEVEAATGQVSGTAHYMAPEMLTGAIRPGNAHLLDVYAFGVLAFEVLAGRVPFDHDDFHALMRLHVTAPIPDLRDLRPDVPAALADLVATCMAKCPGDRPTMEQALWDLRGLRRQAMI
jgi:serine/threonine protein kinase